MTAPSLVRLSLVRTKAPPLPGLTCWNSTILKTVPSTSMWVPFLNWLVLITLRKGSELPLRRGHVEAVAEELLVAEGQVEALAPRRGLGGGQPRPPLEPRLR